MSQGLFGGEASIKVSMALAYDANGNVLYLGQAPPGAATSAAIWQIRRFTYDANGNMTAIWWADGNTVYDNIWDDRATLSYS